MCTPVFTHQPGLLRRPTFRMIFLIFSFFHFTQTVGAFVLTCPQDYTIVLPTGECGTIANFDTLVWSSSVPLIDTVFLPTSGTFLETGTTTVTLAVADANGNVFSCMFNVTVIVGNTTSINCPAAVILSLNGLCERELTATDVFGPNANICPDDYLLQKLSPTGVPISTAIDAFDVNQPFTLRVTHTATFANCETQATVIGGTPPAITCPPPITIVCNEPIDSSNTGAPMLTGCYDEADLTYFDIVNEILCPDSFAYQIIRTWVSTDPYGIQYSCNQFITGMRYDAELIEFPANFDGSDNPPLYCDGTMTLEELTNPLATGVPTYLGFPADGGLHCRVISAYIDFETQTCGSSVTIKRVWDVVKICPPFVTLQDTQTIVVLDETAPMFEVPDTIYVSLSSDCADSLIMPDPVILGECSDFTIVTETPWDTLTDGDNILFFTPPAGQYPVLYRLTDGCGNTAEQPSVIRIDNQTVVQCPQDTTITCDFYFDTLVIALAQNNLEVLSILGMPVYPDNCQYLVSETDSFLVTSCGDGLVQRRLINSNADNPFTCVQNVTVVHVSDFEVQFPADISICSAPATGASGLPVIFDQTCEDVAINFNDQNQQSGIPGCYTVLRNWEVINECTYQGETGIPDPETGDLRFSDGGDGYISHTQVIHVNNQATPAFPQGCELQDIFLEEDSCQATIMLAEPMFTGCGNGLHLSMSSSLGNIPIGASQVGKGTYTVTWTAQDSCGNTGTCTTTFSVLDTVAPVAVCKPSLTVELMSNGMVEVWVTDFDDGSSDNCGTNNLVFSFSPNTVVPSLTFECCTGEGLHNLEVWITDLSGNQSSCMAPLFVQSPMSGCDCNATISGTIRTEAGLPVNQAQVNISGPGGFQQNLMTDTEGFYQTQVPTGLNYTITPSKDTLPVNGVTTFDAVMLTRHIIGAQPLDSPYKIIAADANKSNTATTLDAVEMRRLILNITQQFPNGNTSWRFVDAAYSFPNPANPFAQTFPEAIQLLNLNSNVEELDFTALKVGDLNINADPGFTGQTADDRSFEGEFFFFVQNLDFEAHAVLEVPVFAAPQKILGFQFALAFDPGLLELTEIRPGFVDGDGFGLNQRGEGILKLSWATGEPFTAVEGQPAFTLVFRAKKTGELTGNIWVEPSALLAEAYSAHLTFLKPALIFGETNQASQTLQLLGHRPNPFSQSASVNFYLPQAGIVHFTVFDPSGKVLYGRERFFEKGLHDIEIPGAELPANGLVFYRLESPSGTAESRLVKTQ